MSSPYFSIIIPTYNRAHLIDKTIRSVLNQVFSNFEIIVVDDGSKDHTMQVVSAFTDPRVQYHWKQNGERGAARNFGTSLAKGTYINFFDSDDLMYPTHLEVASQAINLLDSPEFLHLAYDYKDEDGTVTSIVNNFDDKIKSQILFNNRLSCNGVFLRLDIAKRHPFSEERVLASSEDWELWIRLISRFKLHYHNQVTSSVINHDQRSLFVIPCDKVIARDLTLIEKLRGDDLVMKTYGKTFNKFMADRYTFFMLCSSEQKKQKAVLHWAIKALWLYPFVLAKKRFLASIKNSLIP
jgi:glycosyltransferase involved in cell wall biosynthesis